MRDGAIRISKGKQYAGTIYPRRQRTSRGGASKQHARGTHGQRNTPLPNSRRHPARAEAGEASNGDEARSETTSRRGTERPRGTALQAAPSYDKQGGAKGGTRQDSTRAARGQGRHETEMSEASKPTIGARNGETKRNEARDEQSRERGRDTESRRRRGEARHHTDGMTRHRHAIAKVRTGDQAGTTSRPNPTNETGAESKDAVGNARDGEHKPPRHPISKTGRKAGRQEKTGPDADERDPTENRGNKASRGMKTRTAGETIANERKRESDTTR